MNLAQITAPWLRLTTLVVLASSVACARREPAALVPVEVPESYRVEVFADGLLGPTQMIVGPDGRIWLAQLSGEENAGTGQVIALEADDPERRQVLLENLFKPTGIEFLDDGLWIASGRDLLRATLGADGQLAQPETVLEDLPFNGRSNGTLTVSPDGRLIYETSGSRQGNVAAEGSAALWELDPAHPQEPRLIAGGLKNAFGHTFDELGRLWATDVADDPVNGGPPPDELNLIVAGADYGWPACFGDREPATNYGGTEAACAATRPAVAVFPARSTPTSVAISPWEADVLLVALWGPSQPSVVRVHVVIEGSEARADDVSPFVTGPAHPQSLLVLPDESMLVSDFETGTIYQITRP